MYPEFEIKPPFFEIGTKAYLYGKEVLGLAKFADIISAKYEVPIIFTPQYVDIPLLVQETEHLLIFAQHMDPLPIGRGVGSVLPEAVKAAGAVGVLLNHAEKPIPHDVLLETIHRADEVGLASMACAGNLQEVEIVTKMNPNILLAEAPELIGTGERSDEDQEAIRIINQLVWSINPQIPVLHGAGISDEKDVYQVIAKGAQATGSTSGIVLADDPLGMIEKMIRNIRLAWDATH